MATDTPIALDPITVQQPDIPLDSPQPVPPSPQVAQGRAQKADIGLFSVTGQGMPEVYKQILDGNEQAYRSEAADQIDKLQAQQRQQNLSQLAADKGGMLSMDDVLNTGYQPTNPDSVIEQAYGYNVANKNIKQTAIDLDSDVLKDADQDDASKVDAYFNKGSDVLSIREYALKRAEDLEPQVQNNSWNIPSFYIPFTSGTSKSDYSISVGNKTSPWMGILNTVTGLPDEYYMRGNTPDSSGLLLHSNISSQAQEILRQPDFNSAKKMFDAGLEKVMKYSPDLAQQWATSIAGMSTDEMITRDAMSAVTMTGTYGLGKLTGDILEAFGRRSVSNLGRRPPSPPGTGGAGSGTPLRPAPDSPNVQAAKSVIEDVLNTTPAAPTKANIAESVGDNKGAAVQKTIQTFTNPDPIKEATDTLMDMHRQTQVLVAQNPGNISREAHTRLIDDGQNFDKNIVDLLLNTSRVNTLPQALETGFKGLSDKAAEYFRGRESTLANIEVRYNPISNTYDHVFQITDYNGENWNSAQSAVNHAAINGYGDAKLIGRDPETIYLPPTAVLKHTPADTFTTEKGSVYTMEGNTTQRNKFDGTVHAQSEHTGYITEGEYNAYQKSRQGENLSDGTLRLFTDYKNGVHIKARNEPAVGLIPVETLPGNKIHFGHKITKLEGTSKLGPNPNFEIRVHNRGSENEHTTFHLSEPDRLNPGKSVETQVVPSIKPQTGWIPWNTKTKRYGNPVTAEGAKIVPQGLGYHLEWTIPFDESRDVVTAARIGDRTYSASGKTSKYNDDGHFSHLVNAALGYVRSPSDTLSLSENENRTKVVYTKNKILGVLQKEMQHVEDIYKGNLDEGSKIVGALTGRNKQVWNDFKRMLQISQKYPDPVTKLPGYFFQTPAEIDSAWLSTLGRLPSEAETRAYMAVTRLNQADHIFRNIAEYRNKSRLGVMSHVLQATQDGKTQLSDPFEGRFTVKFPSSSEAVVVHEPDGSMYMLGSRNTAARTQLKKEWEAGKYKSIQVYDPDKPVIKFQDVSGNPVRITHVLTKSVVSSPISWKQVPYRGGGHWDYAYDHYIKQPILRKQIVGNKTQVVYTGDRTFSPAMKSMAESKKFLDKLNNVRQLLSERKVAEAKAAHLAYSDMPWKNFVKGFFVKKGETPTFSFTEPFHVVPTGRTVMDVDTEFADRINGSAKYKKQGEFIDGTRSGSLARNFAVEYTGQRDSYDLLAPDNVGTVHKPFYKFQPAELTDPVVALTRSLDRIVNSLFADDYKWSSMMNWLSENGDLLNADAKQIAANPFWHFMDTPMRSADAWSIRGMIAKSNQYKIRKLLGTPSDFDKGVHRIKQTLADYIYENRGTKTGTAKNVVLIPAEWTLHQISRPADFMTGMAFHQILGLWNWTQLAAQQAAYVNFFALSPGHAIPGVAGAWMHLWSHVNAKPAILKALGRKLEGVLGWKPGEWEEARRHYLNTGFNTIGKTMSFQNDGKNFLLSGSARTLKKGTLFFDLAEANGRNGAWYTAFHEFKRAYPTRSIGMAEEGMILRRANDLYMNMGKDNKTLMNSGLARPALQFLQYQMNMAQHFLGKRIGDAFRPDKLVKDADGVYRPQPQGNTLPFRMRQRITMYLVYSMFFGAAGATGLGLLPFNDWMRKSALEHGYVPGQNVASTLFFEGPLSYASALASGYWRTGHLDAEKGTFYNYNNRYGVNGIQFVRDMLEPSSTYWKILLGASGSTFANDLASLSGVTNAIYSAYTDSKNNPWPIKPSDWDNVARNINSYRYAERMVMALEYGKWLDRHGRAYGDVSKTDAIFRSLLGTQDVHIDDMYLMKMTEQDRKALYDRARNEYFEQRRLAEQYAVKGDIDNADVYNGRAMFAITSRQVPYDVASKIFADYYKQNKDLVDQVRESYYLKKVPLDQQKDAAEAYQELMRQK